MKGLKVYAGVRHSAAAWVKKKKKLPTQLKKQNKKTPHFMYC